MNILLCTDNNYAMPTGVLMHSISNHNKDINYYVFVDPHFKESNKTCLIDIAKKYNNKISILTISSPKTAIMPVGRKDQPIYITKSAYHRLFAASLLPKNLDKVIYLDSDIVVRNSLDELWNTNIDDYAVGVVNDMAELNHIESSRLPYNMKCDGYFNSGVLLINLKFWRENNSLSFFYEITMKYKDILTLHDQDVLNIAFHDKKVWLPITYNFQNGFILKSKQFKVSQKVTEEVDFTKYDPTIIHFSTWDKPWKLECFHPYCKDWRRYFFKSEWKNDKLQDEEEYPSFKRRIRNYLVRHCWYVPASLYQDI